MNEIVLFRRRKLGKTSCNEIAKQMKNPVIVVCNGLHDMPHQPATVIRWGCTANAGTPHVVNTAKGIHQVCDKFEFRKTLEKAGLCPKTWFSIQEVEEAQPTYPLIVRPANHAQGRHLYVCHNIEQLILACARFPRYYISEFIDKVAEYRVAVMSGRAVWVAQKTPENPDEVAWNVAKGGRFDNVRWGDWPLKAVQHAIDAFNLSDLDFGGVDVMVDKDGFPYILEINSAPSQTSPYRQSCMAKGFDYMIDNGKDRMTVKCGDNWRNYIHPAISGEAML